MSKTKKVVITGASRGLGALTAKELARQGAYVFVVGLASEVDELKQVASDCGDPDAWAVCDVRNEALVNTAMERAARHLDGIDIVMANAGVASQAVIAGHDYVDKLRLTFDVNFWGAVYTARAAWPYLIESKGYMLFMSSLAGLVNPPMLSTYNASKAAIRAFAETYRLEGQAFGIDTGIGTFSELNTDMTNRGFATKAGEYLLSVKVKFGRKVYVRRVLPVAEVDPAIQGIVRGINRRYRHIHWPRRVFFMRMAPWFVQRVVEQFTKPRMRKAHALALAEEGPLTTALPPTP